MSAVLSLSFGVINFLSHFPLNKIWKKMEKSLFSRERQNEKKKLKAFKLIAGTQIWYNVIP